MLFYTYKKRLRKYDLVMQINLQDLKILLFTNMNSQTN